MSLVTRRAIPDDFDGVKKYWQEVIDADPTAMMRITCDQLPHRTFCGDIYLQALYNTLPLDSDLQAWLGDHYRWRIYIAEDEGQIVGTLMADWTDGRVSWVHATLAKWLDMLLPLVQCQYVDSGTVPWSNVLLAEVAEVLDQVPEFYADRNGDYHLRVD